MTLNFGSNEDPESYRFRLYEDDDHVLQLERGAFTSPHTIASFKQNGHIGISVPEPITSLQVLSPDDAEEMDVYMGNNSDLGYRMHKTRDGHCDFIRGTVSQGRHTARFDASGLLGVERGLYCMLGTDKNMGGDRDWGLYVASSGMGKSLAQGDATGGSNFSGRSLRLRVADAPDAGLIVENSAENRLLSVRGSDGLTLFEGPVQFQGGLDLGDTIHVNRVIFNPDDDDPYYLEKIRNSTGNHELRLTLNDDREEETFQIWGNMSVRHTFDAAGGARHTRNLRVDGNASVGGNLELDHRLDVFGDTSVAGVLRVTNENTDSVLDAFGSTSTQGSLFLQSASNKNKRLTAGWDGANDVAVLQSYWESNSTMPLWINPAGGDVRIGNMVSIVGTNVGIGETNPSHRLHVQGNVFTTGEFTSVSDVRVKKNLRHLDKALARVIKLRGYTYKRIDDETDPELDRIGFVAQELLEVVPEVVFHDKIIDRYSVNYGHITALLAEAVKELNAENGSMRCEVEDLRVRLSSLEALVKR